MFGAGLVWRSVSDNWRGSITGTAQPGDHGTWRRHYALGPFVMPVERLIDAARIVLAGLALIAIWIDPLEPAGNGEVARAVLVLYAACAVALAAIDAVKPLHGIWNFGIHGVDIAVAGALMHYSEERAILFFAFYAFAMITAMLRWGWRGGLASAIVLTGYLVVAGLVDTRRASDLGHSFSRVVMHAGHLLVAGTLVALLGAYLERGRNKLASLVAWPDEELGEPGVPMLESSLRHAANVIGAERIVVAWESRNEPGLKTAHWTGKTCEFGESPDRRLRDIVASELADATFHTTASGRGRVSLPAETTRVGLAILNRDFASELAIEACCSAPFATTNTAGRIFILQAGPLTQELLQLAEIVAARIAGELEQFALSTAAVKQERVRVARDLHDGVLQDLAAAGLMIKALLGAAPDSVKADLHEIAGMLAQQQQRIRSFIRTADPKPPPDWDFAAEFKALAATLQRQWQCEVVAELRPPDLRLPGSLGSQVFMIFGEAMANAVRHGRSTRFEVKVEQKGEILHLLITDDGRGLPGRSGSEAAAPFSLRQRISDLQGTLTVRSSSAGVELKIELPIA